MMPLHVTTTDILILAVCAVTVLFSLCAAGAVGLWALLRAQSSMGEPARALRLIGLQLLEAPVNTLLIAGLIINLPGLLSAAPLLATLPMAVLLLPALRLRFRDADCRLAAKELLAWGLLRWTLSAVLLVFWQPWLAGVGLLALWGSLVACARTVDRLSVGGQIHRQVQGRVERLCRVR